jgi:hypothetical protein
MTALDDVTSGFRAAAQRWPEAVNLQSHYADLAATFENNGSSLVELCKSFIETVCITLLNEMGKSPTDDTSTTKLLVVALSELGLQNTRGASAFDKVLSAYNKLSDALNELRNQEGSVAHGKDGFIDALSAHHARVYVLTADIIVSLLLSAYDGQDPSVLYTREPYGRFRHLDKKIDLSSGLEAEVDEEGILVVRIRGGTISKEGFDLRVPASQLLYCLDRQAYVDVLEALRGVHLEEPEESAARTIDVTLVPSGTEWDRKSAQRRKTPKPVNRYEGKFAERVTPLYEHLYHEVLHGTKAKAKDLQSWTYTLLKGMEELAVVDWSKRETAIAKVRLLVKRTARDMSIGIETDEAMVHKVVDWFAQNITGEGE